MDQNFAKLVKPINDSLSTTHSTSYWLYWSADYNRLGKSNAPCIDPSYDNDKKSGSFIRQSIQQVNIVRPNQFKQ